MKTKMSSAYLFCLNIMHFIYTDETNLTRVVAEIYGAVTYVDNEILRFIEILLHSRNAYYKLNEK